MELATPFEARTHRKKISSLKQCAEIAFGPFKDFASNTSIHGVKYAFEPRRRLIERCIWITSVALCTAGAAALVHTSLQKFYTNPMMTVIQSFANQTSKFPFPAITICNVNLVFRYKADKLIAKLKIPQHINMTKERFIEILPNVAIILNPHDQIDDKMLDELLVLQHIFDANNISSESVLRMLSQSCYDMVERCSWNGAKVDCALHFQTRITFKGYCCSFNDVNTNWTLHPDYDPYKLRSRDYGLGSGLRILLNPMKPDYMRSAHVSSGFTMVAHRSGTYPEGSWQFIEPSEVNIRIRPVFTDADRKLKAVGPKRRGCTFWDERPMITSTTYSREVCVSECRAQAMQTFCGCVPFYYGKHVADDSASANRYAASLTKDPSTYSYEPPVNESRYSCNMNHVKCLRKHINEIESESTVDKCQCAAQCTVLAFEVDITTSNLDAVEYYVGDFYKGANMTGRASVNIFISKQVAQLIKRDIVYTIEQLMSNLGGICSLFLGCSFLTAMEIGYYFLLRASIVYGRICKRCKRLR